MMVPIKFTVKIVSKGLSGAQTGYNLMTDTHEWYKEAATLIVAGKL